MYEIPLLTKSILDRYAQLDTARIIELAEVAQKLSAAGWRTHWTITGLAFDPPATITSESKGKPTPADIRQQLATMGITDEFREGCSRSWSEVITAKREYRDRAWYAYVDRELRTPPDPDSDFICFDDDNTELLEMMKETEELYGRRALIVETDYGRGTLDGRHEALGWLFGDEWPDLEPEDTWEAEEAEMVREWTREEHAIEGFHEILYGKQTAPPGKPDEPNVTQPVLAAH